MTTSQSSPMIVNSLPSDSPMNAVSVESRPWDRQLHEPAALFISKLGEISITFEAKLTKSARRVEIGHPDPGETAPHLEYQYILLEINPHTSST